MNGTFTYSNQPLVKIAGGLCGIFSVRLLTASRPLGLAALVLTALLVYLLEHIIGRYETDWESVTVKILWKAYRIEFCEIQSVRTNICRSEHMRPNGTFRVETELTLCTYREDVVFCARHLISRDDLLKDPDEYQKLLGQFELMQLGRYIESKIKDAAA